MFLFALKNLPGGRFLFRDICHFFMLSSQASHRFAPGHDKKALKGCVKDINGTIASFYHRPKCFYIISITNSSNLGALNRIQRNVTVEKRYWIERMILPAKERQG